MAWTTPLTAVSNAVLTAAQWNASVRDNLNVTPAALATTVGRHFVSTGANAIAERAITTNTVGTSEGTASTSYTNLGTTGPAITMTTSTNSIITLTAQVTNSTASAFSCMGCTVSGSTAIAASDSDAMMWQQPSGTAGARVSAVIMYSTTLTPGSNTFTAQYRASAGTATFVNRKIVGIAL